MASPPVPATISLPGKLLVAVLAALLGVQLAYWTWVFVAPESTAAADAPPAGDVDLAAVARVFGAPPPGQAIAQADGTGLRLKGVIAPSPGSTASAIFAGGGRDIAVPLDGTLLGGYRLVEVHPDHVIVEKDGVRTRIDLDALRRGTAVAAGSGAPGFRVDVNRTGPNQFAFSRRQLDDALRDPAQLNHLGQIGMGSQGGVRIESVPANSLAQKLGLQPGDVIRTVNGQPIGSTGDLARLYTQFNTLSNVDAEVQRGSTIVRYSYSIRP